MEENTKPRKKKRIGCLTVIVGLLVIGMIASLFDDGDDEDYAEPVVVVQVEESPATSTAELSAFGEVQVINQFSGTSGLVVADRNLLTDDQLVAFFHTHIHESGHNFFDIDFGDGTGYRFFGSRNRFSHYRWEEGIGELPINGFSGTITGGEVVIDTHGVTMFMQDNNISVADFIKNPMLLVEYREFRDATDMYFDNGSFVVHVDPAILHRGNSPTAAANLSANGIAETLLLIPELDDYWMELIVHFGDYGTVVFPQDLMYEDWASGMRIMDSMARHWIVEESISVDGAVASLPVQATESETYRAFISTTTTRFSELLNDFSAQNIQAGENPLLLFDQDWIMRAAVTSVQFNMTATSILEYDAVPQGYEEAHEIFSAMANIFLSAMEYYIAGVDDFDPVSIVRAQELILSTSDYLTRAIALMP